MQMYHGTCTLFEESIKLNGLVPKPENKYASQTTIYTDAAIEHNAVYLTANLTTAKEFAQFRADYERAEVGQVVWFNGINPRKKLAGNVNPNAKPIIVVIQAEPTLAIRPDLNMVKIMQGYWTDKAIPATNIVTIKTMPDKPASIYYDRAKQLQNILDNGFESLEDYRRTMLAVSF